MSWLFFICSLLFFIMVLVSISFLEKKIRKFSAMRCGHTTKRKGKVFAFGEERTLQIPKNEEGGVDHCLHCLAGMSTRCAWCGRPIFIGDPITLRAPEDPEYKPPYHEYKVFYCKKPYKLVGCLRNGCAESESDKAGFWHPPGKVVLSIDDYEPQDTASSNPSEVVMAPEKSG
jgi:hypothetical protein